MVRAADGSRPAADGARTAGDSVVVVSPGDLTFRAGQRVDLEDGFEVQSGSFQAKIDPDLEP